MRRAAVAGLGWAALSLAAGCQRRPPQLVVRVGSELAWGPGARVQSVVLNVRRGGVGGVWGRAHTAGLGMGAGGRALPFSIGVIGSDAEAGAPAWVEALGCGAPGGCTAATALVVQRSVGRLARGPTRELPLSLKALCVGVPCASDQRCSSSGRCEPVATTAEAAEATEATEATEAAGRSAGGGPWCPAGMRLIPAGMFQMGEARADDPGARPVHGVRLAAFCLDEAEVTAAAYGACVASTVCTAPGTGARCNGDASGRAQHPANCVGWEQARAFCHRRGADLPTESQWEYAARGRSDLGGNIAEWTLDWFAPYTGDAASYAVDPMGARTGDARVYRGGSWREAALADTRATHRGSGPPTLRSDGVGLRCARSPL